MGFISHKHKFHIIYKNNFYIDFIPLSSGYYKNVIILTTDTHLLACKVTTTHNNIIKE